MVEKRYHLQHDVFLIKANGRLSTICQTSVIVSISLSTMCHKSKICNLPYAIYHPSLSQITVQVSPELNDDIVGGDGVVDLLPAAVDRVDHLGRALHDSAPQVVEDLSHVVDDVACNEVVVMAVITDLELLETVEGQHGCVRRRQNTTVGCATKMLT